MAFHAARSTPRSSRRDGALVHVYDLVRDALTQLTLAPTQGRFPLWTPDGQKVVFYSDFEGGGLFSKAADGTGTAERLTTSAANQLPYSWSADGRTLVFEQRSGAILEESDVHVLSVDGEPAASPLLQTSADEREPAVSPDGGVGA